MPELNLATLAPALFLTGWALALLLVEVVLPGRSRLQALLAGLGLLVALLLSLWQLGEIAGRRSVGWNEMIVLDGLTVAWNVLFLLAAFLTLLLGADFLPRQRLDRPEFYPLLLLATLGMMLMGAAVDLIVLFLGLELLSISLYVLTGFGYPRLESQEAGLKYLLLGAFSSAFLLYGIALTYGASGTTKLAGLSAALHAGAGLLPYAGLGLVLVGLAFKVAAVPFHVWTPDVYQGAPTPVTAFMSVGAKAAGFAALLRVLLEGFPALAEQWVPALAVLSALTMILGNVVAVVQTNVKRLLAYSSIAHAGFILVGVAALASPTAGPLGGEAQRLAVSGVVFYVLAYTFTNLGAFAVVAALADSDSEHLELEDYSGLARRRPLLALGMAVFLISLTGLPPTGGFVGKFYVFAAAINAGLAWLAVVGVLTSVVSAYVYLRIVVHMYMREAELPLAAPVTGLVASAVVLALAGTLLTGIAPGAFIAWVLGAVG